MNLHARKQFLKKQYEFSPKPEMIQHSVLTSQGVRFTLCKPASVAEDYTARIAIRQPRNSNVDTT